MGHFYIIYSSCVIIYNEYNYINMSESHTEINSKEIQPSSDMFIGESYNLSNPNNIPGFKQTTNFRPNYAVNHDKKKKGTIAKFFSNMARLGMHYDDKVIDNMRAIPADKNFIPKQEQLLNQDLFTQMNSSWKVKQNQDKNFFEKDYPQKREAFRKLALQPELEDILDVMTNESIVYDTDLTYFAEPFIEIQELHDVKPEHRKQIENIMGKHYRKLYIFRRLHKKRISYIGKRRKLFHSSTVIFNATFRCLKHCIFH